VFLSSDGNVWYLYAISRGDRKVLCRVALPARPVLGGLSLTRAGDILVPLLDGRLVCVGAAAGGER